MTYSDDILEQAKQTVESTLNYILRDAYHNTDARVRGTHVRSQGLDVDVSESAAALPRKERLDPLQAAALQVYENAYQGAGIRDYLKVEGIEEIQVAMIEQECAKIIIARTHASGDRG